MGEFEAQKLLENIFSSELLKFLERSQELKINPTLGLVEWEFVATKFEIDKTLAEIHMLMSAMSDANSVLATLNAKQNKLSLPASSCSEFANDVFSIIRNTDSSAKFGFNKGMLLQELERLTNFVGDSPAIAVKDRTITINTKTLLDYLHTTFNDLIVYNIDKGISKTLLSSPESSPTIHTPSRVQVLIDMSGSMQNGFSKYISVIKQALSKGFSVCSNLQIDLTPFNHEYYTQSFFDF